MKTTYIILLTLLSLLSYQSAEASYKFSSFKAKPPIHISITSMVQDKTVTPSEIKRIYNLPANGGTGTIAIISAYDNPTIEKDLSVFNTKYNLSSCTTKNKCFEKHAIGKVTDTDTNWSLETSLDVEWAHAIAPNANILLIEAPTASGANLLKAIDYANKRKDVVAISMSWGGAEFPDEVSFDSHFKSNHAKFFAASGDTGNGTSWPSVSPFVISVGGTSLFDRSSEKAWTQSGGGISLYEKEPDYQKEYSIPKANGMRAVPDVAYNADPHSGYPVYRSTPKSKGKWYIVGGTSAGSPQWAAIHSLNLSVSHESLYKDKNSENNTTYFNDIKSGSNGDCTYYCQSRAHYDYVTGLGSPRTGNF